MGRPPFEVPSDPPTAAFLIVNHMMVPEGALRAWKMQITLPSELREGLAPKYSEAMKAQVVAVGEPGKPAVF